ncbi:MAG: HNH endonuclease [Methylococcaceae bacterium]|nr:MAG: HNH endonuclease [Methylococcaceae bacterium]
MKKRLWTEHELEQLRLHYADTLTTDLARRFGRNVASVYRKAHELGLGKSAEYLSSPSARRLNGAEGKASRFCKGHGPWNAGVRGYQAGGRSMETQFKAGTLNGRAAQLHAPIGSERISKDGYRERKISEVGRGSQRWRFVHLLLWEEVHGPVPPGYAVVFCNGNRADVRIENLELISRADLCRRNTIHRFPPELKAAMRTLGKLKRAIEAAHEKQA